MTESPNFADSVHLTSGKSIPDARLSACSHPSWNRLEALVGPLIIC